MLFVLEVRKPHEVWYDKANKMVVRANNSQQAREIAADNCGEEGEAFWLDANESSCDELIACNKTDLICRDCRYA